MSKKTEVIAQGEKGILMDPVFVVIIKVRKDSPVFPE
jgi:hypothetical protein